MTIREGRGNLEGTAELKRRPAAGTPLVWVVSELSGFTDAHTPEAGDVLPGFNWPVRDLVQPHYDV